MKYDYLIIDGNNAFWRAWYKNTMSHLFDGDVLYTGGIQQFLQSIDYLLSTYGYVNKTEIFVLFDNVTSTQELRYILSEGTYKSHRLTKKADKYIYQSLNLLIEILRTYLNNMRLVRIDYCEADDLVKPLLNLLDIKDKKCLLISTDLDWARSITKNVHWYNYKVIRDIDLFNKDYGFLPIDNKIQLYKSIKGDPSDNIKPAVLNIPKKYLLEVLNSIESAKDLLLELDNILIPDKWKLEIRKNEKQIRLNYKLVDFIDIDSDITEYIYYCTENVKKLQYYFSVFNIPFDSRMKKEQHIKKTFLKRKKGSDV